MDLDQRVAVNFMLDKSFEDPTARARFLREARVVGKLKSEHVAQVRDSGTLDNGAPYIVMEFLEGSDLCAMLRQQGPLPVPLAAELLVQACDALAEAHSRGIIHRDLKPANLFVTQRSDGTPLVKVLDFGISKNSAFNDSSVAMTKTSAMMGSPLYMSPEQMRSARDVDLRTDIWALGIVLYELLIGQVPFSAESLGELLYTVMSVPHAPMQTLRQDIPVEIGALVDWCLMKEPAQRAPNVAEVARRLRPFCPPRVLPTIDRISAMMRVAPAPVGASPLATSRSSPPRPPSFSSPGPVGFSSQSLHTAQIPHAHTSAGWGGTTPEKGRGSVVALIVGGLGVVVVLGGLAGAFAWTHRSSTTSAAMQPPPATTEVPSALPAVPPSAAPMSVAAPAASPSPSAAPQPPASPQPLAAVSPASPLPAATAPVSLVRPAAAAAPASPAPRPGPSTGATPPKPTPPTLSIPDTSK
jgi:eukaryotic-like serine/threonine-protein kinase